MDDDGVSVWVGRGEERMGGGGENTLNPHTVFAFSPSKPLKCVTVPIVTVNTTKKYHHHTDDSLCLICDLSETALTFTG